MAEAKRHVTPAVQLRPYQLRWVKDRARFKICLKARQVGYSFATQVEVANTALEKRTQWTILSRTAEQSREFMEGVARLLRAVEAAISIEQSADQFGKIEYAVLTIRLPNGSIIRGKPGNGDTARGASGNVVLDEFAWHQDPDDVWRAVFPVITRGKYRLIVLSTPHGKSGKFYRLWTDTDNGYSRHQCSIHDAKADGLDVDIEELRRGMADPEYFPQEYECQFIDSATAFLTYELIESCEHAAATCELPADFAPRGPLYVGFDVARKKHLSVIWVWEEVGDVLWTRAIVELRAMKFAHQKERLWPLLEWASRGRIDSTGLGMQLAEEAVDDFGEERVEGVTFSGPVKARLAWPFRRKFEDRQVRIPISAAVREDLHSVRKMRMAGSENDRFVAEETEDGHADRFWAGALGVDAAAGGLSWTAPAADYPRVPGRLGPDLRHEPELPTLFTGGGACGRGRSYGAV